MRLIHLKHVFFFTWDINVIKVFRSSNLINSGSESSNATRLEMNLLKSLLSLCLKKKKKTVESSSYHVGFFCLNQSKLKAQSHFRHRTTSCLVSDGARIRRGQTPASRAANRSSASANYTGCSVPRITVGMDPPSPPRSPMDLEVGGWGVQWSGYCWPCMTSFHVVLHDSQFPVLVGFLA